MAGYKRGAKSEQGDSAKPKPGTPQRPEPAGTHETRGDDGKLRKKLS